MVPHAHRGVDAGGAAALDLEGLQEGVAARICAPPLPQPQDPPPRAMGIAWPDAWPAAAAGQLAEERAAPTSSGPKKSASSFLDSPSSFARAYRKNLRCVWNFPGLLLTKHWNFPFKLPKRGPVISKRIVGSSKQLRSC